MIRWLGAFLLLALQSTATLAQGYPTKPVRIVVPYAAGGGVDVTARVIGERLQDSLGQPFLIENRPGAGGIIGLEAVLRAEHDGYTIAMMPSNLSILQPLYGKLSFNPLTDFAPVALVASTPVMIGAHPSLPARSFQELVGYLKANPGKVNYTSCGTASPQHLAGELLKSLAKVDMTHIPFKGCGAALPAVLGGQVPLFFATVAHLVPQMKAGKLIGYAVTTEKRTAFAPDLPTVAESGFPGYNVDVWFGLVAPARTPREIVSRLNAEVNRALSRPEVREKLAVQFYEPLGGTPERFGQVIRGDFERFAAPIKDASIKPD